ncbi:hypothetical protein Halar_2901 [halophilic archaeon DL31]|jgi:hypothetical protein|nr:hypothetical protein Halar_2901 [halophilic archaeon DL31]
MAEPNPAHLRRIVDRFPTPPADDGYARADDLLDGTYGRIATVWLPELRRLVDEYVADACLRETVLAHVESVPSYRLTDGAAPLTERQAALREAAETLEAVSAVSTWYAELRGLLTDSRSDLTLFERLLHDFGYAFAHLLFLGASSPASVVRRLRLAYRLVGVRIDATASGAGGERTTFTCPYRNVGAGTCGERRLCHEKLDRVDDGYVTYLGERGLDYQRPRDCTGSEQCYSTVGRAGVEQWWPKTPPSAVSEL